MSFKQTLLTLSSAAALLALAMQQAHAANWNMHFARVNNSSFNVSWDIVPAPTSDGHDYKVCWEVQSAKGKMCASTHVDVVTVMDTSAGYSPSTGQMGHTIQNLTCGQTYSVRIHKVGTLAMDNGTFSLTC